MYAVSVSLGASSSYVAVAPVSSNTGTAAVSDAVPIKVVANSSGHRNTPVVAALTEQELLFGDNALHQYSRQPQNVVPYLFTYAAAAASIADAQHVLGTVSEHAAESEETTSGLLRVVEAAANQKYKGHCRLTQVASGTRQLGFQYASEPDGELVESFISAEDLFIRFLNYIKEHTIDGACGLTATTGRDKATSSSAKLFLTLVVPRYAFPGAADSAHAARRGRTVEWLKEAVQSSHLGAVVLNTSVVFSDEAAVTAYDAATQERRVPRLLSTAPHNVLVVDWGAHGLCLSLLCSRGGILVCPPQHHNVPYRCFTKGSAAVGDGYFAVGAGSGGDALDVALAERVAAQYMTQQRRLFASPSRNFNALLHLNHALPTIGSTEHPATRLLHEAIPSRAMRRLALLMAEKKVSLNTNPQATSVSVEAEAFYEGMDLIDTQTLTKNKLDNAIRSEWGLLDMFSKAVRAFADNYKDTWTDGFVDTVLLAGGMCQMPSLTKLLAASVQSPEQRSLFAAAVRVLDSSLMGNGVCADELLSVGGCHHSCRVAECYTMQRLATSRQSRKSAGKLQAVVVTQAAETATSVWDALTKGDDDESSDVEDCKQEALMSDPHSGVFLAGNVYLYVGDTTALTCAATQQLPCASLRVLLAHSAALPCRVAIPWSPASPEARTVLYLFTDVHGAPSTDSAADLVEVRPVNSAGLVLHAAAALARGGALGPLCITFTAQAKWNEASEREVQVSVQLVRLPSVGGADIASLVLTPGVFCSSYEFVLQ
ncbi:protein of unknown function - conserved [Leishmania donovani]|uniref:Hypothetical_protein_conserved n=1 Tax=Leishmania donovani TaxID=5661 RepID=A0A504XDV5_LEIDO|nr:hypothetical protein CGC20_33430 [Leishmania donovani]CAJ1991551.1 protein of unknown function - conserved [Leishmania donovani]VDZ47392.1 hypothetical_protein_conserved [Leishmania donovani]